MDYAIKANVSYNSGAGDSINPLALRGSVQHGLLLLTRCC